MQSDEQVSDKVIMEVRGLVKRFPGVTAVDHMDLVINQGEIRAIMGENGAGKSTLCNILTGIHQPSAGEIYFKGQKIAFNHPHEALSVGIRMVYQERNLIGYLTGAQSICLGLEDTKYRYFVDEKKMQQRALAILQEIQADVPLDVPVGELSAAQQQMIEIIRAVAHEPQMLILDEPTAALGNEEARVLFRVMRRLQAKGVGIIIITHKLDEVFEIADTISILRNGKHVITVKNGELDRMDVVKHMLGRSVSHQFPSIVNSARTEDCLRIENFRDAGGKIKGVSMSVRKGEVVGIYGLLGSGRTELLENIFGLYPRKGGRMVLDGEEIGLLSPAKMVEKGLFLIPDDRRDNSIFREFFTLQHNTTLGYLYKIRNALGFIRKRVENEIFAKVVSYPGLRVVYANKNQDIGDLSGGNQQKVVLGRWIFRDNLKLIMLDEPTQGIDVGVKHDIYVLIRELAVKGAAVLMVSSELPELTGVCDRLLILKDGEFVGELQRSEFDDEKILAMVL